MRALHIESTPYIVVDGFFRTVGAVFLFIQLALGVWLVEGKDILALVGTVLIVPFFILPYALVLIS